MSTPASEPRTWRLGPVGQRRFDLALVVGLLLPAVGYLATSEPWWWIFLQVTQIAPLWWRRARAVPVFAVVAASTAVQAVVVDVPLWSQVAFPVAVYSVARYSTRWPGVAALGVGLGGAIVASFVWIEGYGGDIGAQSFASYAVTIATIVVAAWALGTLGRTREAYVDALVERAQRLELEAAQRAELAAADERARIAREMHDVVAHGLSVIVVQADGARYAADQDPAVARQALATIAGTGREALTEMRQLLGLLRAGVDQGTTPQPTLADVERLVTDARSAGGEVDIEQRGSLSTLPDGPSLTAYRVVQEALNNVRKHAGPAARTTVRVTVDETTVDVVVEDDGRGASAADDRRGLGLVGMRERVSVHEGELQAGPRPGGGYRVHARIPL